MSKRATIHTLGCRLNSSESMILQNKLERDGYEIVDFGEPADLAIINTCTVTAHADSKCRNMIRSFIRRNPEAYTAIIGCYSQIGYQELSKINGVDLIVGNQEKLNVLNYVKQGKNSNPLIIRDKILRDDFSIDFADNSNIDKRMNLKIQDGCDFICSFCIIPKARGVSRSRNFNNLMEEAHNLVENGTKEIILTGVNIGTYAHDDKSILDIIDALNAIEGLERIRISSIEPTTIPVALFDRMNDSQHALVPYLHIPLQSGSDRILQKMKRRYSRQEFIDFISLASDSVRDLCLGTDIMVGFPGETDEDFEDSCSLFRDHNFAYCHVFSFSKRESTPAARDPEQVSETIIKSRSAHLRALSARQNRAWNESHLGKIMPVLFEKPQDGLWPGYTENYIPVAVRSERSDLLNTIQFVKLIETNADFVLGEIVELDQRNPHAIFTSAGVAIS